MTRGHEHSEPVWLHPLAYVRSTRGWTHQDVADVIAATSSRLGLGGMAARREKIWRWEHRGVVPDRPSQQALAVAIGVPPERVESMPWPLWLPAGVDIRADFAWTGEGSRAALNDTLEFAVHDRRGFLQLTGAALAAVAGSWATIEAERVDAATAGGRLDDELLDWVERKIPWLRRLDDQMGGESLRQLVDAELRIVADLLNHASYTAGQAARLHAVAAELAQLAGWVSFDAGLHASAQRYYMTGLHASHTAGDRLLGANVLAGMSFQATLTGHPDDAVELARIARRSISSRTSPRVAAMLASREARGFAKGGDALSCANALNRAEEHLSRAIGTSSDPAWVYYFDEAELSAQTGACWVDLGRPRPALQVLDQALATIDLTYVRDRTIYHVRNAAAHLQLGNLDQTCVQLSTAAGLAEQGRSPRSVATIRTLRSRMDEYATEPAVRTLDERLRTLAA